MHLYVQAEVPFSREDFKVQVSLEISKKTRML